MTHPQNIDLLAREAKDNLMLQVSPTAAACQLDSTFLPTLGTLHNLGRRSVARLYRTGSGAHSAVLALGSRFAKEPAVESIALAFENNP